MNKKVFTGLVVLMGVSILGIIAVQLTWMNNALRVKNELFDRGVNEALSNTVSKLENIHNFSIVNELALDDSVHWVHESQAISDSGTEHDVEIHVLSNDTPAMAPAIRKTPPRKVKIIREPGKNAEDEIIELKIEADSNHPNVNSFSYLIKSNKSGDPEPVIIGEDEDIKNGVFFFNNTDTIITSVDSLYNISRVKIDSFLTKLDTLRFFQPNISMRAKEKAYKLKTIANQAVAEIYAWDVREIDPVSLEKLLKEELANKDIPIEFEFGIVRDSIWEYMKETTDSTKLKETGYKIDLYPNDIFQKNIELAVFFPHRDGFVYRSLNWLLIASFFFSLFILVTFALSIYYILRQKKISEMKSDFINNMTHEFKTPIATISVATDSITNEKVVGDPEKIKYFTGMIKKENARMNRQVEDILTIARLDKKDFEFNWETINVHELIDDAVQGILLQVEKREGKVISSLDAVNPMITTDRIHCTNVVYNLLDNALKYSDEKPEIKISTTNKQNGVLVSVEDKGIGMTKAVQNKIFERFYRQTSGNIHNIKGFGLGLSYVKAVLEANHGTITVQSETGKGSKFELFLPFVRK